MTEKLKRPHKPSIAAVSNKLRRDEIYPLFDEIQKVEPAISLERLAARVREKRGVACRQTISSRYYHNRRTGIPVIKPLSNM